MSAEYTFHHRTGAIVLALVDERFVEVHDDHGTAFVPDLSDVEAAVWVARLRAWADRIERERD